MKYNEKERDDAATEYMHDVYGDDAKKIKLFYLDGLEIFNAGYDVAMSKRGANVDALVGVALLILKEWERPTEGVLPGELIARLSQYSVEAREALKPFEERIWECLGKTATTSTKTI